jgi:hypothetical protein|tara:strand:- start:2953 stop:3180 length:228 start_codon:yes stop_codon:yes gene_type:complete
MKGMTFGEARDIAEGTIQYDDHRIIQAAWQFLIDRHHIAHMDDWFQKTAKELIELKICWPPPARRPHHRRYKKKE